MSLKNLILPNFTIELIVLLCITSMSLLLRKRLITLFILGSIKHLSSDIKTKYILIKIIRNLVAVLFFLLMLIISIVPLRILGYHLEIIDSVILITIVYIFLNTIVFFAKDEQRPFLMFLTILPIALETFGLSDYIYKALIDINFNIVAVKVSLYSLIKVILMTVILFWLVGLILKSGEQFFKVRDAKKEHDAELKYKSFTYLVYFTTIIIFLTLIGVKSSDIALVGSAIGIGIGLGLQRVASNFLSGLIIMAEKSIKIGDLLELSNGQLAVVRSLGVRSMILTTFDGKDLIIPNENFITQEAINYTLNDNKVRLSISFFITEKDQVENALSLMKIACLKDRGVYKARPVITCAREVTERGVHLMTLFWLDNVIIAEILRTKSSICSLTLEMFKENGIDLYYEKTLSILRETMNRVSDYKDLDEVPQFVNQFNAKSPSFTDKTPVINKDIKFKNK